MLFLVVGSGQCLPFHYLPLLSESLSSVMQTPYVFSIIQASASFCIIMVIMTIIMIIRIWASVLNALSCCGFRPVPPLTIQCHIIIIIWVPLCNNPKFVCFFCVLSRLEPPFLYMRHNDHHICILRAMLTQGKVITILEYFRFGYGPSPT